MKKILSITIGSFLLFSMAGCLKDKGYDNGEYGLVIPEQNGVAFPESKGSPIFTSINSSTTPISFATNLSLESGGAAKQNIKVTMVLNNTLVADAAASTGVPLTPLPTSAFTVPLVVSIAAGQSLAAVTFTIPNSSLLDPSQTYAVGLSIATVDPGYIIAKTMKDVVIAFTIKNQYDGVYELRAATEHPTNATLAGPVGPVERELATNTANSVIMDPVHPWANGSGSQTPVGYNPIFTVSTTNAVTTTDANSLGFQNDPAYDSKYVPATKTFYVKWRYNGAGGYRVFTDTLKYLRPR